MRQSKKWKLTAQIDQRLNISLINLSEGQNEAGIYGSIENSKGNEQEIFGPGPREIHLIVSSDYAVVTLQQQAFVDAHFLIHIKGNVCFRCILMCFTFYTHHGHEGEVTKMLTIYNIFYLINALNI